jgi:hypothetical protein
MSLRALMRALVLWAVATAVACWLVHRAFALEVDEAHPLAVVSSVWRGGHRVARAVLEGSSDFDPTADEAAEPGSTHVLESVVAEGPVVVWPEIALALSLVPGREGLVARIDGRASYLTPDDLLAMQAYTTASPFRASSCRRAWTYPPRWPVPRTSSGSRFRSSRLAARCGGSVSCGSPRARRGRAQRAPRT